MLYKSYILEQNIKLIENNLFLFFGENLGLKKDLKNKIKLINNNCEFLTFNQDDILKDNNILDKEINNISLFGKKKIFFIESATDKIFKYVVENLEEADDHKIYFFSDVLDKKSKLRNYFEKSKKYGSVPCYADNEITIKRIILEKLKGFDGLSPHNVNLIIDNSNLDRVKLYNELSKILTYFQNRKLETIKLEALLDEKSSDDFNSLKDEALNGNIAKTNKLLSETIIEVEKNIFYLNMINQRLYKLSEVVKISQTSDLNTAINSIRPPIFWKDKPNFNIQIKKWSQNKIIKMLKKTYNTEIEIKSNSTVNKNILIKKLLLDICNFANAS
jgi:DNA polymerase III subunit delta